MKICKIDGCSKKSRQRGWCHMHYCRWWRYGTTDLSSNLGPSLILILALGVAFLILMDILLNG